MSTFPYARYPLPQGWTEHLAPTGQPYYFNALTRESTYIRPVLHSTEPADNIPKKKEKPLLKTLIPGTDWLRVTTTEGNVFYSHKIRKESVWTVPDELKSALEAFTAQETQNSKVEHSSEGPSKQTEQIKRKAEEPVPVDEVITNKRAKIEDEQEETSEEESEDEEEDWQREAAEQLATEAEEERLRKEQEAEFEAERAQKAAEVVVPARVDLSIEEGKALFKNLLREKDVNPLHPWDKSLPIFISDPRYVLLPSVAARREAFDEYCKERARELRQSTVKKEKATGSPKEDFEQLLREEVKSTRASWTDFRRTWKKDRRFYGWGRDDREREKRFRDYLKELGEQKRAAAQKAEADFFTLLKEQSFLAHGTTWKEAKKIIYKDPRYDAVGSSSLREELFNTFKKGKDSTSTQDRTPAQDQPSDESTLDRQERRNRAVKEREDKVKNERQRLDAEIERSKAGVDKEEGERLFRMLLTDAIREPQTTWDKSLPQLRTDPRFANSPLSQSHQIQLFNIHVSRLREKQLVNLHSVFETHSPSLATTFNTLPVNTILSSAPAVKLGYDDEQLEDEFNRWQRERNTTCRAAFDEMMEENSFVEFWGRLSKIGGQGVSGGLEIDAEDIGESGEEKVDMKTLAKNVDIKEMEKVLKNDKRYIMFDHVPEQRERWIRDYLSRLSAPKLSVHVDG